MRQEVREFVPDEYVPLDGGAPVAGEKNREARFVRPGLSRSLQQIHLPWFGTAAICFPLSLLVVAYRFWFLLRVQNIRIGLWEAVRLTFLGQFFNIVVPGTVGGDLVKAWYVSRHTPRKAGVVMTILADRMVGMLELVLLAGGMLTFVLAAGIEPFQHLYKPMITEFVLATFTTVFLAIFLSPRLRRIPGLGWLYQRLAIAHHLEAAGKSIRIFRRRPGYLVWALAVTFVCHLFFLGGIALIGVALGAKVPGYLYFVYLPLIYILGALPITPGGVGWVENLYVEFFRGAASPGVIVALAMLARILPVFWGLPGLVVAITGPGLPKTEQMQQELATAEKETDSRQQTVSDKPPKLL